MATITMDQMYNEWKRTADKQTETEARLSVIEDKLDQVEAALETINTNTDGLEALLTAIRDTAGIKKITDPVDVSDRASRALGKITADDNAIAALGALAAAAVTDPAQNATVIALLKGLLKQLQGTGTGATPVQLTGSYVGYSTDNKFDIAPNPNRGDDFLELDTKRVYIYDGSGWVLLE